MSEPQLIGLSRKLLVDGLVSIFDQVNTGERKGVWVCLEAPSGWGKTRVVRELYRRLAEERQYEGQYWPLDIVTPQGPAESGVRSPQQSILNARKRVHPQMNRASHSLPCWFWWGISATERNGSPSNALVNDIEQLEQHKIFMLARCKTLTTSWRDRYSKEGRELGRLAVEEATSELQGFALDALGTAIPGAGFILSAFLWTIRSARARRAERELIAQPTTGLETTKEADIAEDVVATLRSIARPKFPLIVAIEDLHFADDLLIDVIDQLLVSEQPIMVVTTSWPGEIDQDDCLKPLKWRHNGNRMIRIRHDEPVVDPALPAGAGLQTLHQDERAEIVLLHQPHATPEAKQLLSEHYTNPLQLELYCTLPATTKRVRRNGGVLDLRPDDLTNMPSASSLDSMYDAMWEQFPEAVQHALSMALCLVPTRRP